MKKSLSSLFAIFALAVSFSSVSYGQFGDLINKAKDAAKKTEKKAETTRTENTKATGATPRRTNQIGEIYFSDQPFPAGGGVPNAKEDFSSNEFIYARLVLKDGTVGSVLKPEVDERTKKKMVDFRMYQIKEGYGSGGSFISEIGRNFRVVINDSEMDKSYLDFDIFPSPETATSLFSWGGNPNDGLLYAADMYLFLSKPDTKEGTHKIWTEFTIKGVDFRGNAVSSSDWKKITNSFNFTFRGADFAAIKANYDKLEKTFFNNYRKQKAVNEPLPAEWSAKSSPIIGGFTAASVNSLYTSSFTTSANILKVIKLYAAPPKGQTMWNIQNNQYGIPSYRYSSQYFTVFVRDSSNGVCYYQGFGLRQQYSGAGTYGKTIIDHGPSALLTCDKLGLK